MIGSGEDGAGIAADTLRFAAKFIHPFLTPSIPVLVISCSAFLSPARNCLTADKRAADEVEGEVPSVLILGAVPMVRADEEAMDAVSADRVSIDARRSDEAIEIGVCDLEGGLGSRDEDAVALGITRLIAGLAPLIAGAGTVDGGLDEGADDGPAFSTEPARLGTGNHLSNPLVRF